MSVKIEQVELEEVPATPYGLEGAPYGGKGARGLWNDVLEATEGGKAARLTLGGVKEAKSAQRDVSRMSNIDGVKVRTRTSADEPGVLWVWRK